MHLQGVVHQGWVRKAYVQSQKLIRLIRCRFHRLIKGVSKLKGFLSQLGCKHYILNKSLGLQSKDELLEGAQPL